MTLGRDDLAADFDVISDEFNGTNQDNRGTVRPRHVRQFPNGLWQMILENAFSRVFLGVHWVFDAFATGKGGTAPDFSRNVGGVPLGLTIAEDIYASYAGGGPPSSRRWGRGRASSCTATAARPVEAPARPRDRIRRFRPRHRPRPTRAAS